MRQRIHRLERQQLVENRRRPRWQQHGRRSCTRFLAWSGSSWSNIKGAPAGSSTGGDHAHGFWQPVSGRFIGKGATEGDNKQCPAEGIVPIPAGGLRENSDGTAYSAGNWGVLWTASSSDSSYAHQGQVNSSYANRVSYFRQRGYSVRCIKE